MAKKVFVIWSYNNDMGFGVEVNEEDYENAKELSLEGWNKWNNPEKYPEYEQMGYAEPSMGLMDSAGIDYMILDKEEFMARTDYEII